MGLIDGCIIYKKNEVGDDPDIWRSHGIQARSQIYRNNTTSHTSLKQAHSGNCQKSHKNLMVCRRLAGKTWDSKMDGCTPHY